MVKQYILIMSILTLKCYLVKVPLSWFHQIGCDSPGSSPPNLCVAPVWSHSDVGSPQRMPIRAMAHDTAVAVASMHPTTCPAEFHCSHTHCAMDCAHFDSIRPAVWCRQHLRVRDIRTTGEFVDHVAILLLAILCSATIVCLQMRKKKTKIFYNFICIPYQYQYENIRITHTEPIARVGIRESRKKPLYINLHVTIMPKLKSKAVGMEIKSV